MKSLYKYYISVLKYAELFFINNTHMFITHMYKGYWESFEIRVYLLIFSKEFPLPPSHFFVVRNQSLNQLCEDSIGSKTHSLSQALRMSSSLENRILFRFIFTCGAVRSRKEQYLDCKESTQEISVLYEPNIRCRFWRAEMERSHD